MLLIPVEEAAAAAEDADADDFNVKLKFNGDSR